MSGRQHFFIALEAAARWLPAVAAARATVGTMAPQARLSPDERLHVTLRFLGDLEVPAVDAARAALAAATAAHAPVGVALAAAGTFGKPPHVLWLGVGEGLDALQALAAAIDDQLDKEGQPPRDRPFCAHLTLARSGRRGGDRKLRDVARALDGFRAPRARVEEVVLFRSVSDAEGHRYEAVARSRLSG
jgi:2'-5' RNA ligase